MLKKIQKLSFILFIGLFGVGFMLTGCDLNKNTNDSNNQYELLPKNYPLSEVPIIPGQVLAGANYVQDKKTWIFSVNSQGTDLIPKAIKLLTDKGFKQVDKPSYSGNSSGAAIAIRLQDKQYFVTLSGTSITGAAIAGTVSYLVTKMQ